MAVSTVHTKGFTVAEARARFGDLLDSAEESEQVVIERHGVHFVLQGWRAGAQNVWRELGWRLFRIRRSSLEHVAAAQLAIEPGSIWPLPEIPEPFRDGATLTRDGAATIHWRFADAPRHQGTVQ